jgi:hypothetical protein
VNVVDVVGVVRRWLFLTLVAALVVSDSVAVGAQAPPVATVSVEPGPVVEQWLLRPCNDAVVIYLRPLSFEFRRAGSLAGPLTIGYTTSGTAQPGVHFEPLPGTVTMGPGVDTVTVPVVPRPGPTAELVNLTLQMASVSSPTDLGATSATIEFVSPWDQAPVECGFGFTADEWNRTQMVALGQSPHPLTLEEFVPPVTRPATGRFRLVSGSLPRGLRLRPDGSFSGRALSLGTSVATIEACRPQPPGTCVRTELRIEVVPAAIGREPGCALPALGLLPSFVRAYLRSILPSLATCS